MPLIINTNITSLTAQRHLSTNTNALQKTMERLASGYRINRAGDDAAGLQLSENLRAQIRGTQKALSNIQDGIGVLNIADGTMQTMEDNLQRVRELVIQAANDTYALPQRQAMATEIVQLLVDNDRIANTAEYNGVKLLDGSIPAFNAGTGLGGFFLQVGANDSATNDRIDVQPAMADMRIVGGAGPMGTAMQTIFTAVGSNGGPALITSNTNMDIENNSEAQKLLTVIDLAISEINVRRGNLGAFVNRLEGTANNAAISIENLSASESRIRNVDVAAESANLVRNQILQQASSTILAQANQTPALALQLLQGAG